MPCPWNHVRYWYIYLEPLDSAYLCKPYVLELKLARILYISYVSLHKLHYATIKLCSWARMLLIITMNCYKSNITEHLPSESSLRPIDLQVRLGCPCFSILCSFLDILAFWAATEEANQSMAATCIHCWCRVPWQGRYSIESTKELGGIHTTDN